MFEDQGNRLSRSTVSRGSRWGDRPARHLERARVNRHGQAQPDRLFGPALLPWPPEEDVLCDLRLRLDLDPVQALDEKPNCKSLGGAGVAVAAAARTPAGYSGTPSYFSHLVTIAFFLCSSC